MNEEAVHQWLIKCFGSVQGEEAWQQLNQLPFEVREQLMNQDADKLPSPEEVRTMMQAFAMGGLNSPAQMSDTLEKGPINVKLAQSLALQQATGDNGSVNANIADSARRSISQANLWLDITTNFNPAPGTPEILSREAWVEDTIDSWIKFANPVARSMSDAFTSVIAERFGDVDNAEISGLFAGVVPIPLPEGMNNPVQLMKLLANTSFAMQLGSAAGALSHEVHGSFDQGLALLKNPAGGLIPYNCIDYAKVWNLETTEVMNYLALRELAHARLFASVPWLMPRFESLIIKYSNSINIDLDAMEEQLRSVEAMNPESISGAINLSKVGLSDSEDQKHALESLETLLALTEGWVDCVTWRAGMAHIPHIDQLREMTRRERAAGGPAEVTFEALLGLHLRPKRMREAADLWENITREKGIEERDSLWSHPDLLPSLPEDNSSSNKSGNSKNLGSIENIESIEDIKGIENTGDTGNTGDAKDNSDTKDTGDAENTGDSKDTKDIKEAKSVANTSDAKSSNSNNTSLDSLGLNSSDSEKIDSINWDDELAKLLDDSNYNEDGSSNSSKDSDSTDKNTTDNGSDTINGDTTDNATDGNAKNNNATDDGTNNSSKKDE